MQQNLAGWPAAREHDFFYRVAKHGRSTRKLVEEFLPSLPETVHRSGDTRSIYRPFHFEAEKLTAVCPDFDESLTSLDEALDDVCKSLERVGNYKEGAITLSWGELPERPFHI
jgi:hypothetical protein